MTIDSVTEMWSRRSGTAETPDFGKTFRIAFESGYQVVHSADATEDEIIEAVPVRLLDQYGSIYAFANRIGPSQSVGPTLSIVPVSYAGESGAGSIADLPLNKPPEINWTNSVTSEPVDTDAYGVPFTNYAGDTIEGFQKEISDFTLSVRRNFATIGMYLINQYLDSVNSDTYQGWPPGTGALKQFSATFINDATSGYWDVNARIDFRVPYLVPPARAWWYRYRNEGMNVVTGDTTVVTFSSGGASQQAVAYPVLTAGVVTGISVIDGGEGYSSTPTVTITGSVGSGATATANMTGSGSNQRVDSVTITNGGSGYKLRLARAVDGNKEPEQRPVLLKADGTREYNARNALFIERPMKQYRLPYNALGLI